MHNHPDPTPGHQDHSTQHFREGHQETGTSSKSMPCIQPLNCHSRFGISRNPEHRSNRSSFHGTGRETLEDLLRLPPYLRAGPLFRREDTAIPIPKTIPPGGQMFSPVTEQAFPYPDARTTVCMGPLPSEGTLSTTSVIRLLDSHVESQYNFFLVQLFNRQRWCYLNFVHEGYIQPFVDG